MGTLSDNKRAVDWVNGQYQQIKKARQNLETQWYTNLAFFFGRQWVQLMSSQASTTGVQLFTPAAPPWRVRLVINKIRPIIRTELAKTTSQKPQFTVMPRTTEDIDLNASRVAEQILKCEYDEKEVQERIKSAVWWTLTTGTGFLKDYWSASAKPRSGGTGDFKIEALSPFHLMVPNFKQEDIEEMPYVIHASTLSTEAANMQYQKSLGGYEFTEKDANVNAVKDVFEDSFLNLMGAPAVVKSKELLVLECWIKPGWHKQYPNGGLITTCANRVVVNSDKFPFSHGEYPFSKILHIPAGRFYGTSIIEDLIPLQREYNRTRSQVVENKNRMSKLQLLAQEGSVNPSRITNEPGQVILYKPGYQPPTPLPLQNMPPFVSEELNRLQMDFDDISGQHEISRGGAPSQVTAATAISFLQEQDDTKLSPTVSSIERAVGKIGRHILVYAADFWTQERLIRVMGDDGSFDAKMYKGADIHGNTDVIVEAGSGLPTSKAAKQAFIMDLLKLGAIPPDKAIQVLDIGGIEKIYQDYLLDRRQAQRENLVMTKLNANTVLAAQQQGTVTGAEVHSWDNDQLHIMVHNDFRKGQQFESLDPAVQQVFEAHVQAHEQRIQQQQQQQMAQQQQALIGSGQAPPVGGGMVPGGGQPQPMAGGA